ncbi:carboxylesterase/lipase family protein [Paraburkholderia oxyphila]|uniref:carboxylesterase/lipase family protein n=1 Tax=Paraburkholderia oxyphila TaxID=614212 RepID=UPI000B060A02|nr:carboxylesterase family protein [Paraburkholderia oxyphila]
MQTQQGTATGIEQSGVRQFLGLPYAAPPVGALRWKPPAPVAAYAGGQYDASHFRSVCMQGTASAPTGSEDCLYLNVYVPDAATPASALPVLFWIHGGGFILGSGSQTDGSALAKQANAIVVTINYRLNAFGFLAHPALTAEDPNQVSGDYGIMDQAAALGWVKQNIRTFGGDPANVTIFGDSSGGHSIYVQLASPLSAGLFAKAVAQSGDFSRQQESQAQAETDGIGYATTWGCGSSATTACLRGLSASALLQGNPLTWYATLNTRVLPLSTSAAFASGNFSRVPIVSGFTQNEGTYFVAAAFDAQGQPVTSDGYMAAINAFLDVAGTTTAAQYPSRK